MHTNAMYIMYVYSEFKRILINGMYYGVYMTIVPNLTLNLVFIMANYILYRYCSNLLTSP